MAVDFLQSCSESNHQDSQLLLLRKIPEFSHYTCMELAVSAGAKKFVSHTSFQALLSRTWYGRIASDSSNFRIFFAMFLPFLAPLLISLRPGESADGTSHRLDRQNCLTRIIRSLFAYTRMVSDFLKAPVTKYVYNQVKKFL